MLEKLKAYTSTHPSPYSTLYSKIEANISNIKPEILNSLLEITYNHLVDLSDAGTGFKSSPIQIKKRSYVFKMLFRDNNKYLRITIDNAHNITYHSRDQEYVFGECATKTNGTYSKYKSSNTTDKRINKISTINLIDTIGDLNQEFEDVVSVLEIQLIDVFEGLRDPIVEDNTKKNDEESDRKPSWMKWF